MQNPSPHPGSLNDWLRARQSNRAFFKEKSTVNKVNQTFFIRESRVKTKVKVDQVKMR